MNTRQTIEQYFDRLEQKSGWQDMLAPDVAFTSFTSPTKRVSGKDGFLQATKGFYSSIATVEVRDLLIDGARACALTRYELHPPGGPPIQSDVAEIFTVANDRIASLDIYFDSAAFPKPK